MGNSAPTSNTGNKGIFWFQIRDFGIRSLPNKPKDWDNKMDDKVWEELLDICRDSLPKDTTDRKKIWNKWSRCSILAFVLSVIFIALACYMGVVGARQNKPIIWIFGIILGILAVSGAVFNFFYLRNKARDITQRFTKDTRSNLSTSIVTLSNKYSGSIYFYVPPSERHTTDDADIRIEIEVFAQYVEYKPNPSQLHGKYFHIKS